MRVFENTRQDSASMTVVVLMTTTSLDDRSEVTSERTSEAHKSRMSDHATVPRSASGERYFLSTLGGWSMLNSSVASFPAKSMIAFLPPGWSGRNDVRSYTLPSITTHRSPSELCFAISASVKERAPPDAFATTGGGVGAATPAPPPYAAAGDAAIPAPAPAHCCAPAAAACSGLKCALRVATRLSAVSPPFRDVRSALMAELSRWRHAVSPATRPNTTQSSSEFPPRRLRPWMPPATSPAAYSPGTGMPASETTCDSLLMARPPMV
mmetsp:Transcript_2366/g.9832  ORF Transcript_2366/g.9832 Transcript_2366/m.9832 type:complete len:267 (-) Transcript_2366:1272-2072(-)